MPRRSTASHRPRSTQEDSNPDVPDPSGSHAASVPPEQPEPPPQRDLKFVSVTEQSLQGRHDAGEQKSIRAHVMRDFLRQRDSASEGSSQPATTTAEPQAQHMGRFRLNPKPRKKASQSKSGSSSSSPSGAALYPNREVLPKPPAGGSVSMLPLLESASHGSPGSEQDSQTQIPQSMTTGRLDSFARFPIHETLEMHGLVDYYRTLFIQNSLAVNPEGKWFTYASTDPAVFHATLSLTAQHRAFALGNVGLEEYYFHRGEAIRIVTERLADLSSEIGDATIGAVALLASSDQNMGGSPETLLYHMNGLEQMVNMRGGVAGLTSNEPVRRVVTWADLSNAAMHDSRPRFPLAPWPTGDNIVQHFVPPLPGHSSPPLLPEYPPAPVPSDMAEIFHDIRLLCIALENPQIINMRNSVNRRTHSNNLYHIEWCLLSAAPNSPARTPTLPIETEDTSSGHVKFTGYQNPPTAASCADSPVSNACRHAALIFTYLALRNLPISAAVFDNLIHRLRIALIPLLEYGQPSLPPEIYHGSLAGSPSPLTPRDQANTGENEPRFNYFDDTEFMTSQPPFEASGTLLLWLFVTGFAACSYQRADQRRWYVGHISRVCGELSIVGRDQLTETLKQILWLGSTCQDVVNDLVLEFKGLGKFGW